MPISANRWILGILACWNASSLAALPPDVLLKQSGSTVTVADVEQFVERIPVEDRAGFFSSPKRVEQVLQNLLTQKLVVDDVHRKQQSVADPVLRNAPQADDEAIYRQKMAQLKEASALPDLNPLAHEYYLANKADYVVHGEIRVQYLMKAMEQERPRGAPEAGSAAAARSAMKDLSERIRGDSAEFDLLFEHYAEGKRDDGVVAGTLENVNTDRYPDALSRAARGLDEKHKISSPVEAPLGVYILKLISRGPDKQLSFDEVKETIVETKRNEYVRRETEEYLGRLRTTPLEVNQEAIQALLDRYLKQPPEGHE